MPFLSKTCGVGSGPLRSPMVRLLAPISRTRSRSALRVSLWVEPGVSSEVLKFGLMRTFFPLNGSIFRRSRHFFTPSALEPVMTRTTRDLPAVPATPRPAIGPPPDTAPAENITPPAMPAPAAKNSRLVIPLDLFMTCLLRTDARSVSSNLAYHPLADQPGLFIKTPVFSVRQENPRPAFLALRANRSGRICCRWSQDGSRHRICSRLGS